MNKKELMQRIEEMIDDNKLDDMRLDFYHTISENNIALANLPFTHPLSVMFQMFRIAESGQTEDAWRSYIVLLADSLSEYRATNSD